MNKVLLKKKELLEIKKVDLKNIIDMEDKVQEI